MVVLVLTRHLVFQIANRPAGAVRSASVWQDPGHKRIYRVLGPVCRDFEIRIIAAAGPSVTDRSN